MQDHEVRLLWAAQAGDERAFRELVGQHRPAVQAHCYRMLGSLQDSEDAFQDTLLRAWRALDSLVEERALRGWLFRIATNVCLTALRSEERRALPVDLGPAMESAADHQSRPDSAVRWIGPFRDDLLVGLDNERADPAARYERREAIELAFIAALQHLPPRQRAALILADVLGFKAAEVAVFLETTVVAVSSALQRSRETLRNRLPDRSQQATARGLGPGGLDELATRFVDAFEAGDPSAILRLLTDDVAFEMPPYREWSLGRTAVAESWLMPSPTPSGLRLFRTGSNGQLAFGVYSPAAHGGRLRLEALDVLTLRNEQVSRVVAFRSPEALARCGLPPIIGPENDPHDLFQGDQGRHRVGDGQRELWSSGAARRANGLT